MGWYLLSAENCGVKIQNHPFDFIDIVWHIYQISHWHIFQIMVLTWKRVVPLHTLDKARIRSNVVRIVGDILIKSKFDGRDF